MNDVIIYEYDFFYSIKDKVNDYIINTELLDRIKKLNDYDCFKNKYKTWGKSSYVKKDKFLKRPIIKKTENKEIIGYLNKITIENYNDLSKNIINNICIDNYKLIIDKLFEISYKQTNYFKLYFKLYKLILLNDFEDNNLQYIINNYLNDKFLNIINNNNNDLELIIEHIDKNDLNYNDFCDINKNAKYLKGKIFIICKLIKSDLLKINKNNIIDNLIKYKNYDNEIYLDLLQITNNILNLTENEINILQNYLDTNNFRGKMMIKFKLQDIIQNKLIKEF